MKKSKVLVVFIYIIFSQTFSFASVEEKLAAEGLSRDCEIVDEILGRDSLNKLQKAYMLRVEFECFAKTEMANDNIDAVVDRKDQYEYEVNRVIQEMSQTNKEFSLFILELNLRLPLNEENYEFLTKMLVEKTNQNPPFDETGEHPFQPEVFIFSNYENIARKYYSSGMQEDGQRIINELKLLPYQDSGGIILLQDRMARVYERWQEKQMNSSQRSDDVARTVSDSTVDEDKSLQNSEVALRDSIVEVGTADGTNLGEEDLRADTIEHSGFTKLTRVLLVAVGIIIGIVLLLLHYSNKKKQ
jgi:hypothetical protein